MSFILDALKKSENERQQVTPVELASVPSSPAEARTPMWLWLFGALLVINAAVLAGFMLRSPASEPVAALPASSRPAPPPAAAPEPVAVRTGQAPAETTASFAERVARARTERQPFVAAEPDAGGNDAQPAARDTDAAAAAAASVAAEPAQPEAPQSAGAFLPSVDELRMQGALSLPELHVDIHVYSDAPADRFVFINMNKYRESDRLSEGPVVREITRDGVVLEHRGNAFVLPRE